MGRDARRGTGRAPARRPPSEHPVGPGGQHALRVGLLGGFGVGNLGNDASLEAVAELVRRAAPGAVIRCICPRPDGVSPRLGVHAVDIRAPRASGRLGRVLRVGSRVADARRAVAVVRDLDVLLVPGTGILDDFGGERATGWPYTLLLWLGTARRRGARTAIVSAGAGPFRARVGRRMARWIAALVDYRSFRDETSRSFMRSVGADVSAHDVVPDVVFSLPSPRPVPLADPPLVVVAVMKYSGWYAWERSSSVSGTYEAHLADLCTWLLRRGCQVRLLTADAGDGPATDRVAARLHAAQPDLVDRVTVTKGDDLHEVMAAMAPAAAVVATRYHSVVSALMCGRPTLSLGYGTKNDDLMAAAGLGDYCQHVERIDPDLLRRQLSALLEDGPALTGVVEEQVAGFRVRLAEQEAALNNLVLGSS